MKKRKNKKHNKNIGGGKGVWIGNFYIGSCWQGTKQQMKRTQQAIDERCALYGYDKEDESEEVINA